MSICHAGRRLSAVAVVLSIALAMVSGCNSHDPDRPKLGKVSGKVTYKGQPVTKGSVTFTPASGKGGETGQVASGQIEPDGSYELTTFNTGDGAILGQHIVTVQALVGDSDAGKMKPDGTFDYKLPKSAVPKKYAEVDKSPLRCTVVPEGMTFDIEMKD